MHVANLLPRAARILSLLVLGVALLPGQALAQQRGQSGVRVEAGIEFARPGGQPLLLDAYLADGAAVPQPGVIVVHGGSWQAGARSDMARIAEELTGQRGWPSFSIDYRLDERQGHPAEVEDVQSAVVWVRENASTYGVDPANIVVLGGSAGGHLAALAGALGEGPLDTGTRVRAVVSWSGPMDLTLLAETSDGLAQNVEGFLGCTLADCPDLYAQASPVTHLDPTDPPMFVANSTDERIPLNQAQTMAATLERTGVAHELVVLPGDRHGKQLRNLVIEDTLAFLDIQFGQAPQPTPSTAPTTASTVPGDEREGPAERQRDDGGDGAPLWVMGAVALAVIALVAFIVLRQRRTPPVPEPAAFEQERRPHVRQ